MATKPACKPLQMTRYAGRSGYRVASVSGHLRRPCSTWFCLKEMGNKCLCRNDTEGVDPSWGQGNQLLKVPPRVLILSVMSNRKRTFSPTPNQASPNELLSYLWVWSSSGMTYLSREPGGSLYHYSPFFISLAGLSFTP